MHPAADAEIFIPHLHRGRLGWRPGPPDPPTPTCPGCDAPLAMDLSTGDGPLVVMGACERPRCGEVVTFRRLEGRWIVQERRRRSRTRSN
jgi:hypothetical protein